MSDSDLDKKKQVIGLYGEMQLAMALHERGWQVHRAYIDEGIETNSPDVRDFSFHPKIRYDMGNDVFYIWIAVFSTENNINDKICHFYIFNTKDVSLFDDISIDTYQITDNQKTTLRINKSGTVLNKGKKYDYSCFNNLFFNNFNTLL